MGKRLTRKHRRQNKQAMKFGSKAKPKHKGKSGRTGGMHHKKVKAK